MLLLLRHRPLEVITVIFRRDDPAARFIPDQSGSRSRLAYDIHAPERRHNHQQGGRSKRKIHPASGPQARKRIRVPLPNRTCLLDDNATRLGHGSRLNSRANSQAYGAAKLSHGIDQRSTNGLVLPWESLGREQRQTGPGGIRAHDGEYHGGKPVRPVRRGRGDRDSVQQTRHRRGQRSTHKNKQCRYAAQQLGHNESHQDARHTGGDIPQHGVQRRQSLEVLEEIGSKDEIVVEGGEKEAHDDHGGGEPPIAEDGGLDEWRARKAAGMPALEADLPEREERDQEDGHDEDHGHPGRGPANDIAFCEGEVEG